MEKYEKAIGLKTFYLTIARRLLMTFIIFVPIAIASFVVTRFILKRDYQSTVSMSRGAGTTITTAQHAVLKSYIIDDTINKEEPEKSGALAIAADSLKEQNIIISTSDIKAGLSFATMANGAVSFSFSFTSTKQSITQPVLKAVSEAAVKRLSIATSEYKNANIVSPASNAKDISKNNTYFLIALVAGFVLSLAVPFVYEIVVDEVYDREDVEYLGSSGFELDASKRKEA